MTTNTPVSDSTEGEEKSKLSMYEMALKGDRFRYDYELDLYGTPVEAVLKPLKDELFIPIAAQLEERLDIDEDDLEDGESRKDRAIDDAVDEVEDAKDESGKVDISAMDREFVVIMQRAAKKGLVAEEMEGPNGEPMTEEQKEEMIGMLRGGYSVELGGKVLEISGSVRDATQFRGARGSI